MASEGINTLYVHIYIYTPEVRVFRCYIIHIDITSTAFIESGSDFGCRLLNVTVFIHNVFFLMRVEIGDRGYIRGCGDMDWMAVVEVWGIFVEVQYNVIYGIGLCCCRFSKRYHFSLLLCCYYYFSTIDKNGHSNRKAASLTAEIKLIWIYT